MTDRSSQRTWLFLFLIEFVAVLWAQFLFTHGIPVAIYIFLNLVVIGGNIFVVISELGHDPVHLLSKKQVSPKSI